MSLRHESAKRPKFLLTLSLSTVTALAVAAPLAIQKLQSDDDRPTTSNTIRLDDTLIPTDGPVLELTRGETDQDLNLPDMPARPDAPATDGALAKARAQTSKGARTATTAGTGLGETSTTSP